MHEAERDAIRDAELSTDEKMAELAELLEQDEELEVKLRCLECETVFTGGADHLIGADDCPTCGSEDLEVL